MYLNIKSRLEYSVHLAAISFSLVTSQNRSARLLFTFVAG